MKVNVIRFNFQNPQNSEYNFRPNVISFKSYDAENAAPSRRPLERLYKHKLPCLCCGKTMIDPAEIALLRNSGIFKCNSAAAISILEKYKNNMHNVEKKIFKTLKTESIRNPELNFTEILQKIKEEPEKKLVKTQLGIFKLIEKVSENIDPELRKEVIKLINSEKELISQGNNMFRRKRFVNKFKEIFENSTDISSKEHLLRLARKLPTSYEDPNAFIVKYSTRKPEAIALRLLDYSACTIEHVKPKNRQGENHLFNYIPECMRCNSFRQDRPMMQQLEEHPEMFYNAQKLFDRLIDFANKNELSKTYILKVKQRILEESDKLLNLDTSKLKIFKR